MLDGPPPKPAHKRQRRNKPKSTNVIQMRPFIGGVTDAVIPPVPEGLSEPHQELWKQYWGSEIGQTWATTDVKSVSRLFGFYEERFRIEKTYKQSVLVEGSRKQLALNPLRAAISACDAEILKLEDRFGLNPISRLRLGITFGEAARSLADLNSSLNSDLDDNSNDAYEHDPRQQA